MYVLNILVESVGEIFCGIFLFGSVLENSGSVHVGALTMVDFRSYKLVKRVGLMLASWRKEGGR